MTDSPNKKSKDKRYRSDADIFHDDLYVAPITNASEDEDAIDRLLLNTGFDADNEDEPENDWDAFSPDRSFSGKTGEASNFDIGDEVVWEPVKTGKKEELASFLDDAAMNEPIVDVAPPFVEDITESITLDFDTGAAAGLFEFDKDLEITPIEIDSDETIQVEDLIDPAEIDQESETAVPDFEPASEASQDRSAANYIEEASPAAFHQFKLDQESINRQQAQLIKNLEAKVKKSSILAYIALAIAVVTVAATLSSHPEKYPAVLADVSTHEQDIRPVINAEPMGANRTPTVIEKPATAAQSVQTHLKPGWFVNLNSFKLRSDADSQAAELMRKGVRAEIVEVIVDNAAWYRLRVGGFTDSKQAAAYAEKIKKPLQLNAIWVADK